MRIRLGAFVKVEPRDVDAAVKKAVFFCGEKFEPGTQHPTAARKVVERDRVACVQGAFDFGFVARMKFEGFLNTLDDVNAVYHRVQNLCERRFGKWGTPLTDSCDFGSYKVRTTIDDIGSGRLRRTDKPMAGRRQ